MTPTLTAVVGFDTRLNSQAFGMACAEVLAAVPAYNLALRILPLPNQPYSAEAVTGFYQSAATFRGRDNHAMAKGDFRIGNSDGYANASINLADRIATPNQERMTIMARPERQVAPGIFICERDLSLTLHPARSLLAEGELVGTYRR